MLAPGTKCKTKADLLHLSKGTPVTVHTTSNSKGVIGKTGMILVNVPTGGCLFYKESGLEVLDE